MYYHQWIVGFMVVVTTMTGCTNPGLKIKITENGLKYVSQIAVEILKKSLSEIQIPDISGDADVDVIGHISYELKNLKIISLNLPDATISTVSDTGLKASIVNGELGVHGDWSYHNHGFIHISDHGSADIKASSITLSLVIQIGDSDGKFAISSTDNECSFNVGSLDIDFHGGASWLYNLFSGTISDSLRDELNGEMCKEIVDEVNGDLAKQVAGIKLVSNIDDYAYVDYSLISDPKCSNESLVSYHKGEILSRKDHQDVPVPAPPIPAAGTESTRMLYLWLTEYVTSSAAYVYYKSGFLEYNITNDLVPSPFSLNTSKFPFSSVIPQLEKHYPNLEMYIDAKANREPVLNMTTGGLKGAVFGFLDFYAIQKNKPSIFLFSLSASMNLSASAKVNTLNNTISANFTLDSSSFKLAKSAPELGDISGNIKNLDKLMGILFSGVLMPQLNEYGAEGLPIPSVDGIEMVKPSIAFGKGFIRIATDIQYTVAID